MSRYLLEGLVIVGKDERTEGVIEVGVADKRLVFYGMSFDEMANKNEEKEETDG